MIERVHTGNEALFAAACAIEPIYGSKCLSSLRCYGDRHPEATFWVGTVDGSPVCALYCKDGVLTCSSDSRLPMEELAAFIRSHGIHEVDTNWTDCQALHQLLGGNTESSYYMYYRKSSCRPSSLPLLPCSDLSQVFSVLQQSHEFYRTHYTLETWSKDIQAKLDAGELELYQLDLDGRPIGTGCLVSEDGKVGVLAAIAVIPEYRHRGIGGEITRHLVCRILEKGKTPGLISGYDAVAELYRQVGFQEDGRWGELYL